MDKLLKLLKSNADFTAKQLAAMLGETEEAVESRIAEYKKQGIILGKQTIINWDKVPDADLKAIIGLKVTPKAETGFDDIAKAVLAFDNVENVYLVASSSYDLLATTRGSSMQEIAEFVSKRISTLDNVVGTATSFVLTNYKTCGIPTVDNEEEQEQRSMIL